MGKNFSEWHDWKTRIDLKKQGPYFFEREIWWCSLGLNVGTEEDGKHAQFERPVLVFRKFNQDLFWAIPLTSRKRTGIFYHSIVLHRVERTLLLSQMRLLSGKRLLRHMGKIHVEQFRMAEQAVLLLIKETDPLRSPRVP